MNHRTSFTLRIISLILCAFSVVLFKGSDSSAWFTTYQNADLVLNVPGFNNSGYLINPNDGLLFNHPMNISTDNTHLLLADTRNNRILIWNSLPAGNVSPDIVLGQTSLTSNDPGTSLSQLNWPVGVSAAAGKVVVADTDNHRILIWNSFPTSNGQSADLYINNLPLPTDAALRGFDKAWPWGLWTDGTKLVASATQAGKVLIWNTFPTVNNQAPDLTIDGVGHFSTPRSIGTDGRTFLVVSDHNASPTSMFWNSFPSTNAAYSFAMNNPEGSGVQMMEGGVLTSGGKFVIQTPPGISIWNGVPTSATQASNLFAGRSVANGVLQQEDERCTADGYAFDDGDGSHLAITSSGKVYISLYNGNKVVGYNALPTYKQQCPDFVIGSPDIATNTYSSKYIQNPIPATNGTSLVVGSDFDDTFSVWQTLPHADAIPPDYTFRFSGFSPTSLAVLNNTWVAVGNSHEVRIWNGLPGPNDTNMTAVFTGGIGPVTFQNARGIALDSKYLYVSDNTSGKLYVWNALPNQNTAPLFTLSIPGADRLSSDGQYLAVIDSQNHKVNIYDVSTLSSSSSPVAQIPPAGASYNFSLGPGSVLVADGHLFVADNVYHRVLTWKTMSDAIASHSPDAVLGQQDINQGMNPAIGKNRLFIPMLLTYSGNKLWVGEFKFQSRLIEFKAGAFDDVPGGIWYENYAQAIYNAHITVGCSQSPLMYCPDTGVTRGQMAAFIIRANYGENFTYTLTPYFSDVPATHVFFKYVQKMKDAGITGVTGSYDVNGIVTRGQMAAFIIRAKYGENFTYTLTPYFSDVPATHVFFKYVQKMKDAGITGVTGSYDVNGTVTRGQMAAFIARAFLGMP